MALLEMNVLKILSLNKHILLQTIAQELNVTRRTTKPFIPTNAPNYWGLQRQVQEMEEPIPQLKAPR